MVDRDGLENRCTLMGTQGSNPCLSAKKEQPQGCSFCLNRIQRVDPLLLNSRGEEITTSFSKEGDIVFSMDEAYAIKLSDLH